MSTDKRTMATDALEVLGNVITDKDVGRDAIHLAVEPVTAASSLRPGDHVGRNRDGTYGVHCPGPHVGIVDPFITTPIKKGDRFLLIIYPRKITSLRHVWSHPDFPEDVPAPERAVEERTSPETEFIRELERAIADSEYPDKIEVDDLIDAMDAQPDSGGWKSNYVTIRGEDASGKMYLPDSVWIKFQEARGRPAHGDPRFGGDGVIFSCTC